MARKQSWRQRFANWSGRSRSVAEDIGVAEAPSGGGVKRDPSETLVKKVGLAMDVGQSREYQTPDFDLTAITRAYDTEAYVRQAVDKYIEMMFKSGWDIVGKNQQAVDYIRLRLKLMAEMTEIPTDQLFIEIAEDLVKYSNVIVVKARDKQGLLSGSNIGVNIQGLGGLEPVAGYFPINVTTIAVLRDKNGSVKGWQQEVDGQDKPVKFKSIDVVHFYYKREKGKAFGTPFLLAALEDIRSLRQMEETVLRLTYRNLHPLLHIQVGSEKLPGQPGEVDTVRDEFENMDLEAALVTSDRVNVNAVSSDGIIDANNYMKYFEQRVFTGLGVSEMMMGRGATASRSTGDNLSSEFADRVKAFQRVMAIFVDQNMIGEMLMEGGFDPVLNPDDNVDFVFKEINVDAKIKAENHAIYQYEHNAITEDEMRTLIGRDPIADRAQMFMNLVSIPTATSKSADAEGTDGTAAANNKNKPTNQHGTKPSPKAKESTHWQRYIESLDYVFDSSYKTIANTVADYLATGDDAKMTLLREQVRQTEEDLVLTMERQLGSDYAKPYAVHLNRLCQQFHQQTVETISSMSGTDRGARVYETLGGIHEVQLLRLEDIAKRAFDAYSASPVEPKQEEVE